MSLFFNAVEHHRERSTSRPSSARSRHNVAIDSFSCITEKPQCMLPTKYPTTTATARKDSVSKRSDSASSRCGHCDRAIIPRDAQSLDQMMSDGTLSREGFVLEHGRSSGLGTQSLPGQITNLDSTRTTFASSSHDNANENTKKSCLMSISAKINADIPALVLTTAAAA
nr:hypothetical protein CFP56_16956 [Quercus suber]